MGEKGGGGGWEGREGGRIENTRRTIICIPLVCHGYQSKTNLSWALVLERVTLEELPSTLSIR